MTPHEHLHRFAREHWPQLSTRDRTTLVDTVMDRRPGVYPSAQGWARRVGVHPSTLHYRVGGSVLEVVSRVRLELVRYWMLRGKGVREATALAGYPDPSGAYQVARRIYGVTLAELAGIRWEEAA